MIEDMSGESQFWGKLKNNISALDFLERVENKLHPGWPDVHFLDGGNSGWIELKSEDKLPSRIDFRPGQPLWLDNYWRKGGTCYIFLFTRSDNKIRVWEGLHARALDKPGGAREITPCLEVKANSEGWLAIFELLSRAGISRR